MIYFQFDDLTLEVELFDHPVNDELKNKIPFTINLEKWGNEYYGPIGVDIPQMNPVDFIPEGGLAYSQQGTYLCIFFGQSPAWPVDYIGFIKGDRWKELVSSSYKSVLLTDVIDKSS